MAATNGGGAGIAVRARHDPSLIRELEKTVDPLQNARQAITAAVDATRQRNASAADAAIDRASKHLSAADLSEGG